MGLIFFFILRFYIVNLQDIFWGIKALLSPPPNFLRGTIPPAPLSLRPCWLLAQPITSCGLKLHDEAVRVAVGTRLALKFRVPHQCRCGSEVDSFGRHSLVCKRAPGRTVSKGSATFFKVGYNLRA